MDRLSTDVKITRLKRQVLAVLLFVIGLTAILAFKAIDEGWFEPHAPLDLSNAPVLLFFNRHKGCDCEMAVYTAAAEQVKGWTEAARSGVQIIQIDMDRRPDMGVQFNLARAPALLLVGQYGKTIFGQRESQSDIAPFDLEAFEKAIRELKNGESN